MQEFKKRHTKPHYLLRFAAMLASTAVLFAVAGVAVSSAWNMYDTFTAATVAREDAEQNLAAAQSDEARVQATVAALGTQAGVEREVRERFGVVKPGEGEIQIVRDSAPEEAQTTQNQNIFVRTLRSLFVW